MAKIRYLHQPPGRDDFYLRRRVPDDVRALFNCGDFYKVPLGTKDPQAAGPLLAIANGEFEKKVAAFREALSDQNRGALSADEAKALIERYLNRRSNSGFASGGTQATFILLELDREVDDLAGNRIPTYQEMSAEEWRDYRKRLTGSCDDDEFGGESLARIEADHAARHRPPGEAWFEFHARVPRRRWRPLLTGAIAALKRELALTDGEVPGIDEPLADALAAALLAPEIRNQLPQAPSPRRLERTTRAKPDMKLSALLIRWKDARKPTPKAIVAAEKAIASFTSYVGDIGIGEIIADDCFEFRDALAVMPASMTHPERRLPFAELVTRYENRSDVERVKPASVKKYLGAIQALLGYAFQERFVPVNVAAGIKVEGYGKASDRRPFTEEELARLFAAPLFVRPWSLGRSRTTVSDATLRWLFLLGLCTGGRIEELGQILVADVKQADGVWYIDVTAYVASDAADVGSTPAKRVKTASSVRVLPLHPWLVELGFPDHVLRLRATGTVKLFEDLRPDSLSVQTKEASRLAARVIDKAVSTDPRIVFHSFRHTFKDLCRNAGIPKDVHDQLTGHAPADVGGSYGLGHAVAILAEHMHRIDLDFIDWALIVSASKV